MIPDKPIRVSEDDLRPIEELEVLPAIIKNILTSESGEGSIMILEVDDQEYVIHLHPFESTHITFIAQGFHKTAHLPSIYQIYVQTMKDIGCELVKCVIEGSSGDVMYARLTWADKKLRRFSNLCTVVDAIAIALIMKCEIKIVVRILGDMNTTDDIDYTYFTYEEWNDDDE